MALIDEIARSQNQVRAAVRDGAETISQRQRIKFRAYTRTVLPIDQYVFWQPLEEREFFGFLHYTQEIAQGEDETYNAATATFTCESKIVDFTESPINRIWVASAGGSRFAFAQQNGFNESADTWHYFGHSLPPAMEAQLLDTPGQIDPSQAITSNSLALWLDLNTFKNPTTGITGLPGRLLLYPAGLVPPNLKPAYGVVSINGDTRALQAVQHIDPRTGTATQLCVDRVKITLYGLQNNAANDFLGSVLFYSSFTDNFGLMNNPALIDGTRSMAELAAVAMQKFIYFEVSYYQTRVNDIAQKLIKSALAKYYVGDVSIST